MSRTSTAEMAERIRDARARLQHTSSLAPASTSTVTTVSQCQGVSITRRYDDAYSADDIDWLPQRAELEIHPKDDAQHGELGEYRELVITLSTGPDAMYRYYPFAAYVYVDNVAAAIAEFDREWQAQELRVVVPATRPFVLKVTSELADIRQQPLGASADQRELALVLLGIEPGRAVTEVFRTHASSTAPPEVGVQHRTALIRESPRPVFVVSAYRSGTSILTWAIGQHPNVWPLEETGWLHLFGLGAAGGHRLASAAKRSFFDVYDLGFSEYMSHVGSSIDNLLRVASLRHFDRVNLERLSGKAQSGFERFDPRFQLARSLYDSKHRWVDGTPENAENMLLLKTMFPEAQFVCLFRHPFDVIASMVHFERAGGDPMSIEDAANMWLRKVEAYTLAAEAFGSTCVHLVNYDELISAPAEQTQSIFDFVGEPRFPKATETLSVRINSSNVDAQERMAVRTAVGASSMAGALTATYDRVLALCGAKWQPNERALNLLQERQNDILDRIVCQVV